MRKEPNKSLIGLFALIGILLFVGIVLLFSYDKIFLKKEDQVVMYFEESVKGLYVGAPVVLHGVEVGKVVKIDLVADVYKMEFRIPVYVSFSPNYIVDDGDDDDDDDDDELFLEKAIEHGMRARLATQNLLTGNLMIELQMSPGSEIVFRGDGKRAEIPTLLSPIGELSKGVEKLPIKETIENFNKLLEVSGEKVPKVLDAVYELTNNVNKHLEDGHDSRENIFDNLNKTIRDFGEAAQAMRNFADYIERHPEALLKGKGEY